MTNGTEEVDQDTLGTIKRHAGLGMALGIAIAIAGVLSVLSPFIAGLSVTIAVGVLLIVSGSSSLFLALQDGLVQGRSAGVCVGHSVAGSGRLPGLPSWHWAIGADLVLGGLPRPGRRL